MWSYWPVCEYSVRLSRNVLEVACCPAAVIYGGDQQKIKVVHLFLASTIIYIYKIKRLAQIEEKKLEEEKEEYLANHRTVKFTTEFSTVNYQRTPSTATTCFSHYCIADPDPDQLW